MKYATEFEQVLYIHLTSEFEVSLLDGEVTNNCRRTLEDLQKNFDLLQFDSKIVEILEYKVSSFSHRIPQHDLELYYSTNQRRLGQMHFTNCIEGAAYCIGGTEEEG